MKKRITIFFLFTFIVASSYAENPRYALHLSNPLGMVQKVGAKLEFRQNQTGLLFFVNQYYGNLPDYPGTQLGMEGRLYLIPALNKRSEFFFYGKLLGGYQQEREAYGDSFFAHAYVPGGMYYGLGGGIGKHINFNHFFIEFNGGLKGILSTAKQELPFYLAGPGSIIDLHFNLGFQL